MSVYMNQKPHKQRNPKFKKEWPLTAENIHKNESIHEANLYKQKNLKL